VDDEANLGLKPRYEFTKKSHTVDITGPIHSDIFFQDQLMLDGVNLRIKLNQAKNVFCLVSSAGAANFKVIITEAILFVRRVKVFLLYHSRPCSCAKTLQRQVPHPQNGLQLGCSLFQEDLTNFNPYNIFLGHIPKCIVLGLVDRCL